MYGGISPDIRANIIWRYLPVEDILKQCSTSKSMQRICDDPETWRYLLDRDYNMESHTDDPRLEYMVQKDREMILNKYRNYIDHIDNSINKNISSIKAVDIETGDIVIANNRKYHFVTYSVRPFGSPEYKDVTFAYNYNLSPDKTRLYDYILHLIFDAQE